MKKLQPYFFLVVMISFFCNSCQLGRFFVYNFADIQDYKKFPSRPLHNDSTKFLFPTNTTAAPKTITFAKKGEIPFEEYLEKGKTVAFLIIKNDTIQYEQYFKHYTESSLVTSFSMAKSVISILIGCAIEDGLIGSVDDSITKYIPEIKDKELSKVSIRHLLQMTSGIRFNESYVNPFGHAASFYYGLNLKKAIWNLKAKTEPGKKFEYISGNTQVLGLILSNALKTKTVTQYLQEKIWQPLGMEYDASWSIDKKKDGLEKTFCCINAVARDFAKIGRLYLNKGNWNGKQIVSEEWVRESTKIDTSVGSAWYYQYQWWIPSKDGAFMAEGILGQFIYVHPAKKLIIVRLGKAHGKTNWKAVFAALAAKY